MRPFIAPHHTKASGSPTLQQRQGITLLDNTGKAFEKEKDGYIAFTNLLKGNLVAHLNQFQQAGHALPTGEKLKTLLTALHKHYFGYVRLVAQHPDKVMMQILDNEFWIFDRKLTSSSAEFKYIQNENILGKNALKHFNYWEKKNCFPLIAVTPIGSDSHKNTKTNYVWDTVDIKFTKSLLAYPERFKKFITKFQINPYVGQIRQERDELQFFPLFFKLLCAPNEYYYPRERDNVEIIKTPLVRGWNENRRSVQIGNEKKDIAVWVIEALEEAQSYKPLQRQTPKPIIKKR
jgi:hypothetical protein